MPNKGFLIFSPPRFACSQWNNNWSWWWSLIYCNMHEVFFLAFHLIFLCRIELKKINRISCVYLFLRIIHIFLFHRQLDRFLAVCMIIVVKPSKIFIFTQIAPTASKIYIHVHKCIVLEDNELLPSLAIHMWILCLLTIN